jgi:hypothetical protein
MAHHDVVILPYRRKGQAVRAVAPRRFGIPALAQPVAGMLACSLATLVKETVKRR